MSHAWKGRGVACCWVLGLALWSARAEGQRSMKPPGDCTKEEHRELKRAVGEACKSVGMKCTEHDDCATLWKNLRQQSQCISARQRIADRCFRGGDETHLREIGNYKKGADDCRNYIADKNCPPDPCDCKEQPLRGRRSPHRMKHGSSPRRSKRAFRDAPVDVPVRTPAAAPRSPPG
jgi:hypothetical protein